MRNPVPGRAGWAGALALAAVSLAGCGSSSPARHTTASQTTAATPSQQPTTTTTRASHPPHHRRQAHPVKPATSTTTTAHTLTAPPPVPSGTPAAPDGLRQTTGYGMYELCSSQCSGAVPTSLRRALHLPSVSSGQACPVAAGSGPVRLLGGATRLQVSPFIGSSWQGGRVTWSASGYSGPILIRGRELGGPHAVGFGEGHVPYDELQLLGRAMGSPAGQWPSFTRVRSPGCYGYQIDGTSFSEVIVFRATG